MARPTVSNLLRGYHRAMGFCYPPAPHYLVCTNSVYAISMPRRAHEVVSKKGHLVGTGSSPMPGELLHHQLAVEPRHLIALI
jgi:hypothetical protein